MRRVATAVIGQPHALTHTRFVVAAPEATPCIPFQREDGRDVPECDEADESDSGSTGACSAE